MPIIILDGSGGVNKAGVDSDGNLRVTARPPAFGALGYYRQAAVSGVLASTLAAGPLWSCRWTSGVAVALVQSVRCNLIVNATVSAAVNFALSLTVARSYTATDTGGTAVGVPASMQKLRTSMGSSLMADWRIATTTAFTAGTRTLDTNPIAEVQGCPTAIGTTLSGNGSNVNLYQRDTPDNHPIVLAQNEGLVLASTVAGPVTGSYILLVQMEWGEVASF